MKKIPTFIAGAVFGLALSVSTVAVAANTDLVAKIMNVKITVDGKQLALTDKPLLVNGRTYLPVRTVADGLGYSVTGLTDTQISLSKKSTSSTNTNNGNTDVKENEETAPKYVKNLKAIISIDGQMNANKLKVAIGAKEVTVNSQDEETGDSLLQLAIRENNVDVYKVLKDGKVDPQLKNKKGETALHTVIIADNNYYFGELINELGVKKQYKNNAGKYPIDLAVPNSAYYVSLLSIEKA